MAREGKNEPTQVGLTPIARKREGPTPLKELDPNVVDQKRRIGKKQTKPSLGDEEQMDGDEAVAVMQHCEPNEYHCLELLGVGVYPGGTNPRR